MEEEQVLKDLCVVAAPNGPVSEDKFDEYDPPYVTFMYEKFYDSPCYPYRELNCPTNCRGRITTMNSKTPLSLSLDTIKMSTPSQSYIQQRQS